MPGRGRFGMQQWDGAVEGQAGPGDRAASPQGCPQPQPEENRGGRDGHSALGKTAGTERILTGQKHNNPLLPLTLG